MIDFSLMNPDHPRMAPAIAELSATLRARFPDAEIRAVVLGDPIVGVHLVVATDADLDDVIDSVSERLVDLQVDEGLPLYLFPTELSPSERKARAAQAEGALLPTGH